MMKGGKEILKKSRQADGKFNASGSRIRTLRKAMGLSQEQLAAQRIRYHPENGQPHGDRGSDHS